jgi:hypothetical protein
MHTSALAIATETGDRDEQTRAQAGINQSRGSLARGQLATPAASW